MLRDQPKLLTTHQVARRLNLSEDAVRRKLREGLIPGVRLGNSERSQYRVDEAELRDWLHGNPSGPLLDAQAPAERRAPELSPAVEAWQHGGEAA